MVNEFMQSATNATELDKIYSRLQRLTELICSPQTLNTLKLVKAEDIDTADVKKIQTTGLDTGNYGMGDGSFFLDDGEGSLFPVINEFPVLIFPERIVGKDHSEIVNLLSPQYHEAYTEMAHYNAIGHTHSDNISDERLHELMAGSADLSADRSQFPRPVETWIDATHDSVSQFEAYEYLSPMDGKTFLQLGGGGAHAVKALLAGAKEGILLTPMLGEAQFAKSLAEHFGVEDRLFCVIAVGEELPFKEKSFDRMYSGGCLHHMRTNLAFAEMKRVLTDGGRFACVDPWKTLLHNFGTRVFGKREKGVFCRPIDPARLEPVSIFENHKITRHGPVLRYFFLALQKAGIQLAPRNMMRVMRVDDTIGNALGITKKFGGSIVICGQR